MSRKVACWLQMVGFAVVLAVPVAQAQEAPPVRIRGTIERVDGSIYVVKARDGAELKLTLSDKLQIAGVMKASLSDIKQGSFVGVTAMPQADGSQGPTGRLTGPFSDDAVGGKLGKPASGRLGSTDSRKDGTVIPALCPLISA
jgi:hypothetical protein